MTLDQAIKHSDEVAKRQEEDSKFYKISRNDEKRSASCKSCAEEHRQLAEWLKDYKRLLEQETEMEKIIKMRDATPEERESTAKYIQTISKPTGVNFWDLQQPYEDAISRAKAIEICKSRGHNNSAHYISELPPVTPQQKTGHWIKITNGRDGHECSVCHAYAPSYQNGDEHLTKYCPNCGAKMESEVEE